MSESGRVEVLAIWDKEDGEDGPEAEDAADKWRADNARVVGVDPERAALDFAEKQFYDNAETHLQLYVIRVRTSDGKIHEFDVDMEVVPQFHVADSRVIGEDGA